MKLLHKLILIIIIIQIIFSIPQVSFASGEEFSLSGVLEQGKDWLDKGKQNANQTMDTEKIKDTSGRLFNIFFAIAFVLAVIFGALLGIQIMTSSIEKKADAKQGLIPYAIGCIVAFGALGIWKLAIIILSNFNNL